MRSWSIIFLSRRRTRTGAPSLEISTGLSAKKSLVFISRCTASMIGPSSITKALCIASILNWL